MEQLSLPFVIEADGDGTPAAEYARRDRERIRERMRRHGAVLLRGFDVGGVDGFEAVVREISGEPLTYSERSSPRSAIQNRIYTSTDYPPGEEIFLHNENSYQAVWPLVLYFYCVNPPQTQGATPLADTREVLRALDPEVRDSFARRGWRVVRNFRPEFGLTWQEAFNTEDRDEVAAYCRRNGLEASWRDGDVLRTTAVREAVHRHPVTGEEVWFNHATVFHVSTLGEQTRQAMQDLFPEDDLPSNTSYGDGGRIPDEVLDHLRACYRKASVRFDYHRDDLLVVDNMLAAHGREPFTGPRRIAVAMTEPSA